MNINPFELKSLAAFLSSYTNCWIVFLHKRQFQNYLPHNKSTQSISYSNFFEFQFTARYWQQHHSIQLYLCFRAAQMKSSAESRPLEMGKCVYIFINEKRFIIMLNIPRLRLKCQNLLQSNAIIVIAILALRQVERLLAWGFI